MTETFIDIDRTGLSATRFCRLAAIVFVLTTVACSSKGNLDKKVDIVVLAFQSGNYAQFCAVSHPALIAKVDIKSFNEISAIVKQLGAFRERTMTGIKAELGGSRSGTYRLDFDVGTVDLELGTQDDKLIKFEFSGDPVLRATNNIENAKYQKFEVNNFQFVTADGTPNPGGAVFASSGFHFKGRVQGLTRNSGYVHVNIHFTVYAPDGTIVLDNPKFMNKAFLLPPDEPPVVVFTGSVEPNLKDPRASKFKGTFKLVFRITDGYGQRAIEYVQMVQIQ